MPRLAISSNKTNYNCELEIWYIHLSKNQRNTQQLSLLYFILFDEIPFALVGMIRQYPSP